MSSFHELVARLAPSVQPLVFETGLEDCPYGTAGTVFLVGYKGKPYVVTTRHALDAKNLPTLCVFPTDTSQRVLPLGRALVVSEADEPDDFMDLAVIDVIPSAKAHPELGQAVLIDWAKAYEPDWSTNAEQMVLNVLGYPSEMSEVDTDTQILRTDRVVLSGKYGGLSSQPYLHLFQIGDSRKLGSYSGFSGGPVFGSRIISGEYAKPILCGMVVRGTPKSGVFHFLDASVLLSALEVKSQQDLLTFDKSLSVGQREQGG